MPETNKSAEGLAHELKTELEDILGNNGVNDSPLWDSQSGRKEDRVVIDIKPVFGQEQARIERIHQTIGRLTTPSSE